MSRRCQLHGTELMHAPELTPLLLNSTHTGEDQHTNRMPLYCAQCNPKCNPKAPHRVSGGLLHSPLKPGEAQEGVVVLEGALASLVRHHRNRQDVAEWVLLPDGFTQPGAQAWGRKPRGTQVSSFRLQRRALCKALPGSGTANSCLYKALRPFSSPELLYNVRAGGVH